jgi:short-subunit dehydrogenase
MSDVCGWWSVVCGLSSFKGIDFKDLKYNMSLKQKYGPLALVAGASEGIGAAFSYYLAASGINLVLVARRKEPLEELAAVLRNKYKVEVSCICCDLASHDAAVQLQDMLQGKEINILVYNVALSFIGPFENNSPEHNEAIARANMLTPMALLHQLGNRMLEKKRGAIIVMSSLAGFQGTGFLAAYAASKAFNTVLAESLWYEWKTRGVDIIACCAGSTATPNFIKTKPAKQTFFAPAVQQPAEVVKECFKQLGKRPSFVSGTGNKIASFIMRHLLARKMVVKIMGDTMRKMYNV